MNSKAGWIIFLLLSTIAFFLISVNKQKLIKETPYNQDEIDYVANSFLLSHYSLNQIDSTIWDQEWAYDQPHLYHYLVGYYLQNKYKQPAENILKQYHFDLRQASPNNYSVVWNTSFNSRDFINSHHLIDQLRIINFWIYVLSFFIICLTSYVISGRMGIVLSLILYHFTNVFTTTLIPATSDALLFFFINLFLFVCSVQLRYKLIKNTFVLFLTLSTVSGLAFSTKINGGVLIMISCYLSLFNTRNIDKIKNLLLSVIVPTFMFFITNPYLLIKPIDNFVYMIWWRFCVNQNFWVWKMPDSISPSPIVRFVVNSGHVFSNGDFSIFSLIFVCFIFYYNIRYILKTNSGELDKKLLIPIVFLIEVVCFSYISTTWPRYYTPLRLAFYFNIITILTIFRDKNRCRK